MALAQKQTHRLVKLSRESRYKSIQLQLHKYSGQNKNSPHKLIYLNVLITIDSKV